MIFRLMQMLIVLLVLVVCWALLLLPVYIAGL